MKVLLLAMLVLSAGVIAVAAAPTASACAVSQDDPVGDLVDCVDRPVQLVCDRVDYPC